MAKKRKFKDGHYVDEAGQRKDHPIPKAKPSGGDAVDGATIRRLMAYIGRNYRFRFTAVVIFIIISSIVTALSSLFIGNVVDDFITPMLKQSHPNFAPLLHTVIVMGVVLLYHGFMDCKHGLDVKSCGTGGWTAALVLGVCICAAGVLLLVNPFEKNDTLLFAAALGFLLDGISGLFTTVAVAHGKARAEFLAGQAPVIELDPAEAAETLPEGKTEPVPETDAAPAKDDNSTEPEKSE